MKLSLKEMKRLGKDSLLLPDEHSEVSNFHVLQTFSNNFSVVAGRASCVKKPWKHFLRLANGASEKLLCFVMIRKPSATTRTF